MSDPQDLTLGEVGRTVERIESKLDEALTRLNAHDTDIAVLKSSRSTAIWLLNGFWALILVLAEWALHRR
jgi:hypothetical protein